MKINQKLTLFFLLQITFCLVKAQDTIVFKNKIIESTKIIEVGVTEVKYKRFSNMDGPMYTINKNDVIFIKYKNGVVDSIRQEISVKALKSIENGMVDKVELRLNSFLYNGELYDVKHLNTLLDKYRALSPNYINLKSTARDLYVCDKKIRRAGPSLAALGIVGTPAILVVGLFAAFVEQDLDWLIGAGIVGVVFCASFEISAIRMKSKYTKKQSAKRTEFINFFNQNL